MNTFHPDSGWDRIPKSENGSLIAQIELIPLGVGGLIEQERSREGVEQSINGALLEKAFWCEKNGDGTIA